MAPRTFSTLMLLLAAMGIILPAAPAAASPACDLLRMCAGQLADEMAGGPEAACGRIWPAATIAQYRRVSVTNFEAGGAAHACGPTFQVIAHNAFMFHQNGQLCRLPVACKPENFGDLPALPGD